MRGTTIKVWNGRKTAWFTSGCIFRITFSWRTLVSSQEEGCLVIMSFWFNLRSFYFFGFVITFDISHTNISFCFLPVYFWFAYCKFWAIFCENVFFLICRRIIFNIGSLFFLHWFFHRWSSVFLPIICKFLFPHFVWERSIRDVDKFFSIFIVLTLWNCFSTLMFGGAC